jgi:hypothetical protein
MDHSVDPVQNGGAFIFIQGDNREDTSFDTEFSDYIDLSSLGPSQVSDSSISPSSFVASKSSAGFRDSRLFLMFLNDAR